MRNFGLILAPLAILAAPLAAAPNETGVTINHADLDLTTKAGIDRLNRRIGNRIRSFCETGTPGIAARQHELQCRAAALAEAQTKARVAVAAANIEKTRFAEAAPASRSANPGV